MADSPSGCGSQSMHSCGKVVRLAPYHKCVEDAPAFLDSGLNNYSLSLE